MNRKIITSLEFEQFTQSLIGLPLSHIWQGYGSAIFLEFGALQPRRKRDGSEGNNPCGAWTLMIEWSWRIEGKRRIWCGSSSERERWPRVFNWLKGNTVSSILLIGRLSEIDIAMSNSTHIVSCMTAEGDPAWGLIHRYEDRAASIDVVAGRLTFCDELANRTR